MFFFFLIYYCWLNYRWKSNNELQNFEYKTKGNIKFIKLKKKIIFRFKSRQGPSPLWNFTFFFFKAIIESVTELELWICNRIGKIFRRPITSLYLLSPSLSILSMFSLELNPPPQLTYETNIPAKNYTSNQLRNLHFCFVFF